MEKISRKNQKRNVRGISALVATIVLIIITAIAITVLWFAIVPMILQAYNQNPSQYLSNNSAVRVGSWNLENFGDTKASNQTLMKEYVSVIRNFDIMFVQEIKDADGSAFRELCGMLKDYNCIVTDRMGTTQNKEQFGIIYKIGIENPSIEEMPYLRSEFERPPAIAIFKILNESMIFYVVHLKPTNVSAEMNNLEKIVRYDNDIILMGDFNADCDYYDNSKETQFDKWNWLIDDSMDTTTTSTDCAYDRIISARKIMQFGIWRSGVSRELSNHYPIWILFQK